MVVLSTVKDILLLNPIPADNYRRIKSRIIATFAVSPEAKLRKLLKGQVLTDGKLSLILSRLRNLHDGASCDDSVIRSIFFDQLPSTHRAILVATGGDDLNRLAEAADKLADSAGAADTCVATVSRRAPSPSSVEGDIKRILASITSLSERVARLEARNNRPRSRAVSRSRSSGNRGRSAERATPRLCVAHTKYPENPTSCKSWGAKFASWQTKN
ncbi:hypothetical protein WN55_06045 [Dufourea novaeangliae]|uniref:Uncharacterized protein n=1 Tax=Dufourea novaeangliae TaxID=178035 RepID=A0A154PNU0_DUFNO|nr:hypothetical protein WN55_06045 [Dufourea novaeangliae]